MNPTKAMTHSRYAFHVAQPTRRLPANLVPHTIAIVAAFSFVSALIIGAI
ncbi:hypothetical protein [Sinorhizobium sp. CCBAU 05631]|nr:hypothetical protein [Sinorhizobium sp. CCBAU 05631]ASY57582.1 hypothetical protein SS05631_c26530 [Sinorhizobium sp. CCBAU 05631]